MSEAKRKRYGLEEYRDVIIAPPYKVEYTKLAESKSGGRHAREGGAAGRACTCTSTSTRNLCGALGNGRIWLLGRRVRCTVTELRWPEPERSLK